MGGLRASAAAVRPLPAPLLLDDEEGKAEVEHTPFDTAYQLRKGQREVTWCSRLAWLMHQHHTPLISPGSDPMASYSAPFIRSWRLC